MKEIGLYLYFHKTTLIINWPFSIVFTILLHILFQTPILYGFSISSMTIGFLLPLLIKESTFSNKDEYYFYYNFGITKPKLILFSSVLNFVFVLILIIGYSLWKTIY